MNGTKTFRIVMDREQVDQELLLLAQPSLPLAKGTLQRSIPFVGILDGRAVGVCLLIKHTECYEIQNLGVEPESRGNGFGKELLLYALDFVRVHGGRFVEIGCANADVRLFTMLQRLGFRVVGVWRDHMSLARRQVTRIDGIVNRDMIRMQIDLTDQANGVDIDFQH